jgi:hypothetical protein
MWEKKIQIYSVFKKQNVMNRIYLRLVQVLSQYKLKYTAWSVGVMVVSSHGFLLLIDLSNIRLVLRFPSLEYLAPCIMLTV